MLWLGMGVTVGGIRVLEGVRELCSKVGGPVGKLDFFRVLG